MAGHDLKAFRWLGGVTFSSNVSKIWWDFLDFYRLLPL